MRPFLSSLNQNLAFDQIIQVLDPALGLCVCLNRLLDNFVQLSAVKELATVCKDVIRSVVQYFKNKKLHHRSQLGVISEVLLIFDSEFELYNSY